MDNFLFCLESSRGRLFFSGGRLFANKGALLRNKDGVLEGRRIETESTISAREVILFRKASQSNPYGKDKVLLQLYQLQLNYPFVF